MIVNYEIKAMLEFKTSTETNLTKTIDHLYILNLQDLLLDFQTSHIKNYDDTLLKTLFSNVNVYEDNSPNVISILVKYNSNTLNMITILTKFLDYVVVRFPQLKYSVSQPIKR